MKTRVSAWGILVILCGSVWAADAGDGLRPFSQQVFVGIGASPAPCPAEVIERTPSYQHNDCAVVPMSFREFKKAWRRSARANAELSAKSLAWRRRGASWRERAYRLGRTPLVVGFEVAVGALVLSYADAFAYCEETPPVAPSGVVPPVLIRDSVGDYARAYRPRKRDRRLQVVARVVVDGEGRANVRCLDRSRGRSYDHEALLAIQRWRYEPALQGGKPVEFELSVVVAIVPDWARTPEPVRYDPWPPPPESTGPSLSGGC